MNDDNMTQTKNITKAQFIKFLESKGACSEGLAFAKAQDDARDIIAKCERTDWLIWLVEEVCGDAWAEYLRVEGAALLEYERAAGAAYAEYQRVEGAALAEYERVEGEAARSALTWERVCEAVITNCVKESK
jgi:hypothetical protein